MKTKLFKRIVVVIVAITMLLSLNLAEVLAATDASGRDLNRSVSLTIYKYKYAENLFEGIEKNGLSQEEEIPGTAEAVEGVIFQIEQVTLRSGVNGATKDPDDYEAIDPDDEDLKAIGTTNEEGKLIFSSAEDTTSGPITSSIQKIPGQGIYKVSEVKSATAGTTAIADFIVSLPMENPDTKSSETWLYDVYAYPKNDVETTIKKEMVESGPSNLITWNYSIIIPEDIDNPPTGKESLIITDELDYRLTYVTGSMKGTYTTRDGSKEAVELESGEDYELKTEPGEENSIQILTISITPDGFKKLVAAHTDTGDETPMMYFSFETKTNIGSQVSDLGKIYNGGELDYTNSEGYQYDKETIGDPDKPEIDVYGIKIYKINVNNEVLAGAKFNIYISREDAVSEGTDKALRKPDFEEGEEGEGGEDGEGDEDGDLWEVSTNDEGYAYFYGLVKGTYYLVETEAPAGYNPISEPIEVVISADAEGKTVDTDNTVQVTVTNKKGFELPSTGGIGTILFTAAGLVLIGTAVILLILVKRKKTKNIMSA